MSHDIESQRDSAPRAVERSQPIKVLEMLAALDDFSLKFALHSRTTPQELLDFGCGSGPATEAVLARGGRICAVDSDSVQIERLIRRVPIEQRARLRVMVQELSRVDFEGARFGAVHSARALHRLKGEAAERTLRKLFDALYAGGRLFLSVLTPQCLCQDCDPVHLIDEQTLRSELEATGFWIEELSCYPLPWDSSQICCGAVARRPL